MRTEFVNCVPSVPKCYIVSYFCLACFLGDYSCPNELLLYKAHQIFTMFQKVFVKVIKEYVILPFFKCPHDGNAVKHVHIHTNEN